MANQTFGRPTLEGAVLRSDRPARPVAREPSLYAARGFPIMVGHCTPSLGPRPTAPSPVQAFRKRSTKKRRRHPIPMDATHLGRVTRTTGVPTRRELTTLARARFNTNLLP